MSELIIYIYLVFQGVEKMNEITQGTMVYGVKTAKYPGIIAYGIVISARCDLAQRKINRIFYLSGIGLYEWIQSSVGIEEAILPSIINRVESLLKNESLEWEVLREYTEDEFEKVVAYEVKKPERIIETYKKYKNYSSKKLSKAERIQIIKNEEKTVTEYISKLVNGQNSHYIFVPENALEIDENDSLRENGGLIIDLQDLDFWKLEDAMLLMDYGIDEKVLKPEEKDYFNSRFFILDGEGYAMPLSPIKSPWIEYIMQHFSNCFIRIGVDNPDRAKVASLIKSLNARGV